MYTGLIVACARSFGIYYRIFPSINDIPTGQINVVYTDKSKCGYHHIIDDKLPGIRKAHISVIIEENRFGYIRTDFQFKRAINYQSKCAAFGR